jgi:hypothetical protein
VESWDVNESLFSAGSRPGRRYPVLNFPEADGGSLEAPVPPTMSQFTRRKKGKS